VKNLHLLHAMIKNATFARVKSSYPEVKDWRQLCRVFGEPYESFQPRQILAENPRCGIGVDTPPHLLIHDGRGRKKGIKCKPKDRTAR
jgi:hypothetical protein